MTVERGGPDQPAARRALICGVTGQDGAYLAQYLVGKGYDVVGTTRSVTSADLSRLRVTGVFDGVRLVPVSLLDKDAVATMLQAVQPDEIYHLAALSSVGLSFDEPHEALESSIMSTMNLLDAIRRLIPHARLFCAGSGEVFGDTGETKANEQTPYRPRSPYGVAKAAATNLVSLYREAHGLFVCSGILFNHESPIRPHRFVTRKIVDAVQQIATGNADKLILGAVSIKRDWGWAPEYVDAYWRMLQLDQPEDFVLATGSTIALSSFVAAAFDELGLDWRDHTVFDESLLRPSEPAVIRADPGKAAKTLHWVAATKGEEVARRLVREWTSNA